MKGNEKILEKLNDLLSDELTAVNQYMVHAEMDDDWSYSRLAETVVWVRARAAAVSAAAPAAPRLRTDAAPAQVRSS